MKKRMLYIVFILLLFLPMYWLNKDTPIQYQWQPTFKTNDKEPYGAYAFDKILNDSWKDNYIHNYYSFYDIASVTADNQEDEDNEDTISDSTEINPLYNVLIVANSVRLDTTETKFLLKYVKSGGSVILATDYIDGPLADSLNISINYRYSLLDLSIKQEEEKIRFCAPDSGQTGFNFPKPLVTNYFEIKDTVNYSYYDSLYRISTTSDDKTISLRYTIGDGNLIMLANPLIFTNYGILSDSINPYIWKHLAYLKGKPLMRTEYYETGSQGGKNQSEFRVILRERAFKWAYYTILAGILIFMIFTAKRKQKIIPVILPPANKMLAFVRSIAGLYLLKNNNADLILKKQVYWGEELKRKYGIDIVNEPHDYDFYKRVAAKTRRPVDEIRRLFIDLGVIDETTYVSDEEMMRLVAEMNEM